MDQPGNSTKKNLFGVCAERGSEKKGNFTKKNLFGVCAERGSEKKGNSNKKNLFGVCAERGSEKGTVGYLGSGQYYSCVQSGCKSLQSFI